MTANLSVVRVRVNATQQSSSRSIRGRYLANARARPWRRPPLARPPALTTTARAPLRARALACSASARLYSRGITFTMRRCRLRPVRQQPFGIRLPVSVTCFMIASCSEVDLVGLDQRFQVDHLAVAAARELAVGVEHVGDAAAHAGREVAPGPAEHDDAAAGHVLAAVIADAFDDHRGAAVAHAEPLAGHAADERLAAGRAVERDVADDDVLLGLERRQPSAGRRSAGRPTAPCRSRRWRRPPASTSCRAGRTRRSSGRPSR